MAQAWTFFEQELEYIAAVTKALNSLPECDGYYLQVQLREDVSHTKAGEWCYESASDANFFTSAIHDSKEN